MGFVTFAYAVTTLWGIIHLLHYLITHPRSRLNTLPLPASSFSDPHSRLNVYGARVILRHLYLRLESRAFNRWHDGFTTKLSLKAHAKLRQLLLVFYNVGAAAGVFGMVIALVLLVITTSRSIYILLEPSDLKTVAKGPAQASMSFVKRQYDIGSDEMSVGKPSSYAPSVQLIHIIWNTTFVWSIVFIPNYQIPGLTVPLSHLPLLLIALLVAQIIHEAGHAFAAALESIPLYSVGASLTVIFPSAFVALTASSMSRASTSPLARLRIVGAGAFHNMILWVFLYLLALSSIGNILWSILGYQNVENFGRVVVSVSETSPLTAHLPLGTLITSLDDRLLIPSPGIHDVWTSYLTSTPTLRHTPDHKTDVMGWCTDRETFFQAPNECCLKHDPSSGLTCFVSSGSGSRFEKCLSPLSALHIQSSLTPHLSTRIQRCAADLDCDSDALCVQPRSDQEILRIGLRYPEKTQTASDDGETVIVYNGPREEVLEDVEVGIYLPRTSFLPVKLPAIMMVFFEYLTTLTLSLYLFNLLPFPHLDGSQFLEALLDFVPLTSFPPTLNSLLRRSDVEMGSASDVGHLSAQAHPGTNGRNWGKARHDIHRWIQFATCCLAGLCLFAAIMQFILS